MCAIYRVPCTMYHLGTVPLLGHAPCTMYPCTMCRVQCTMRHTPLHHAYSIKYTPPVYDKTNTKKTQTDNFMGHKKCGSRYTEHSVERGLFPCKKKKSTNSAWVIGSVSSYKPFFPQ